MCMTVYTKLYQWYLHLTGLHNCQVGILNARGLENTEMRQSPTLTILTMNFTKTDQLMPAAKSGDGQLDRQHAIC